MEPRVIQTSKRSITARARVWRLQSDAVLCDAAAHENELAFNELFRRHYRDLSAFVFHFLGARHRHEDAEDVVQEAFARAFDRIRDQQFSGDFRRWLFTIARNRSIDLLRGERVGLVSLESPVLTATPQTTAAETIPVAATETRDEVAWLVSAISKLPERQRSALLLRELAGLSHEAIAEELGATPASVRQLISRARDGVRDSAERDGREHAPRRDKSLRRELLDAAPVLPIAATGLVGAVGTGAGGTLAVGKLVATVLATLLVAGAAGTVTREVTDANGSPGKSAPAYAVSAADSGTRTGSVASREQSSVNSSLKSHNSSGALPKGDQLSKRGAARADEVTATPDSGATDAHKSEHVDTQPVAAPALPKPVKGIVELPGNVVENVTDGLNGSSPPDQVVGNVLTDVTDTLGETTSGLLGSGPGSGAH